MTTVSEARQERRIAALEAASRIHSGFEDVYTSEILETADKFLEWLEKR